MTAPRRTLAQLGYVYRKAPKDFIRPDASGRFHAKVAGRLVKIHYDVFGENGAHITNIPLPIHLQGERTRIREHLQHRP